ncbi:hypothetical protein [Agrococcus sp. KRD186]|uniref:hypothetical protein n=1 Tax=Agrococcus sp. KRD186 TaxID=2729730 RepID=UPI0019D17B3C|nr:hypothetical protein [Agrococcus sp. KRD186]
MDQSPESAAQHDGEQPAAQHRHDVEVRVRRAPKFGVFMLLGAVVGALVAWVVSAVQAPGVDEAGRPVDTSGILGLTIVVGVVLGVGVGAVVALLVDRSLAKRGRMLVAEQTDVEAPEQPQAAVAPADAGEASFEHLPHGEAADPERRPLPDEAADADQRPLPDEAADADQRPLPDDPEQPPLPDEPGDDPAQERDRPSGA